MMNYNKNGDNYYEMVSDDDDDDGTLGVGNENQQFTQRPSQAFVIPSLDFEELPFVPKFSSEIRNTVEAAKKSENDSSVIPLVGDWGCGSSNSSKNSALLSCPYFPSQSDPPVSVEETIKCESENTPSLPASCGNAKPNSLSLKCCPESSSVIDPTVSDVGHNSVPVNNALSMSSINEGGNEIGGVQTSSTWADENGDPIQGAFDYNAESGSTSESCVNIVNNTKVEYVFHVKEKKNDPEVKSHSDVGSVSDHWNSHGPVLSSLANLASDSITETKTINCVNKDTSSVVPAEHYDEKKLYEASKNKQELCSAVSEGETNASPSGSGSSYKDVLSKKKTELNVFKRHNFINQKKGDDFPEEPGTSTTAEVTNQDKTLDSLALNELLREVKQGAERAKSYGALGWQKQPIPVVNKRFLQNTLVSTLREPYKPPGKRGRFHTGLRNDNDRDAESSGSSNSSSSSRSSSRSHSSSSYSTSRSRSRGSRSRSHDRKHHGHRHGGSGRGNHQGPWPGAPPNAAFYDWAAMSQYGGFPWYDPESLAMYYGMDRYPEMYYNDPEFWAAYRDFYGIGFQPGFRGRGPRGRGWRGRGRGRGNGAGGVGSDNERWNDRYSDNNSVSRSRSRSPTPTDRRKRSRSRSRESHSGNKRSHSRSGSHGSKSKGGESPEPSRKSRYDSERSGSKKREQKAENETAEDSKKKKKRSGSRSTSQVSNVGSKDLDQKDKKKKRKKKHKKLKKGGNEDVSDKIDGFSKKGNEENSGENNEKSGENGSETSNNKKKGMKLKRKIGKDDDGATTKGLKKKKKTDAKKAGDEKGKKKKSDLKSKKIESKIDEGITKTKSDGGVQNAGGNDSVVGNYDGGSVGFSDDTMCKDRNLAQGDNLSGSGKSDRNVEKKEERSEKVESSRGNRSSQDRGSRRRPGDNEEKFDNYDCNKMEAEEKCKENRTGSEKVRALVSEKGRAKGIENEGDKRDGNESDRGAVRKESKRTGGRFNEAKGGKKEFEERRSREDGSERSNRCFDDRQRKYKVSKDEQKYECSNSNRGSDNNKGRKLGKIEEIERRLKERKARYELEENLRRKESDRSRVERRMSEGVEDDKKQNETRNTENPKDLKKDLKSCSERSEKFVGKKVKDKKLKTAVKKKGKKTSSEVNEEKGSDGSIKKKKKIKRKIDKGEQVVVGTIKKKNDYSEAIVNEKDSVIDSAESAIVKDPVGCERNSDKFLDKQSCNPAVMQDHVRKSNSGDGLQS